MKKIILILSLITILPLIVLSTNPPEVKNTKPVLSNLLGREGIESYRIPVFLVKFVLSFSDQAEELQPLFSGARFINIAVCENADKDYTESYKRVCKGLELSSYINLVDIVDHKSKITIKALFSNDLIRELVILVRDDDNFIAMSIIGKIDPNSIADEIKKLSKTKSNEL